MLAVPLLIPFPHDAQRKRGEGGPSPWSPVTVWEIGMELPASGWVGVRTFWGEGNFYIFPLIFILKQSGRENVWESKTKRDLPWVCLFHFQTLATARTQKGLSQSQEHQLCVQCWWLKAESSYTDFPGVLVRRCVPSAPHPGFLFFFFFGGNIQTHVC